MRRDEALEKLRLLKPRFGEMNIKRLALFGSTARDEAKPESDVDIFIEFAQRPAGLIELARRKRELEEYLHCSVDLYPFGSFNKPRHQHILEETVNV